MKLFRSSITLLTFLLLSSLYGFGQVQKSYLVLTGAYSIPVGEYASNTFSEFDASLAGAGLSGGLAYEFNFTRNLGFRLMTSYNINTTRTKPVEDKAAELLEVYRPMINEQGTYTWAAESTKWSIATGLIGPTLFINLGNVRLGGYVAAGPIHVRSPRISLSGVSTSGNNAIQATLFNNKDTALGYGAGLSLRVPISETVQFHLSGDAVLAKANFKDLAFSGSIGSVQISQSPNPNRSLGIVNIGAGFVFGFGGER